MSEFNVLDRVADAFNPTLLAVTLLAPALKPVGLKVRLARWYVVALSSLVFVYGLMYADKHFGLWTKAGLDYSTHTAFALVLTMLWTAAGLPYFAVALIAFLTYIALVLYQGYHSVADVVTTGLALFTVSTVLLRVARPSRHQSTHSAA